MKIKMPEGTVNQIDRILRDANPGMEISFVLVAREQDNPEGMILTGANVCPDCQFELIRDLEEAMRRELGDPFPDGAIRVEIIPDKSEMN